MKAEWKDKWVAALRSGEYKQTREQLYDGKGYCCLGVLCKITGKKFFRDDYNHYYHYYVKDTQNGIREDIVLPTDVMNEVDMRTKNGAYRPGLLLVNLNDSGKTFSEIADVIEEHWEAL